MALVRIRYKGLSDVRVISKKDAEAHGVKLSQDLVWDKHGENVGGKVRGINRPKSANTARGIVVDGLSDAMLEVLKQEGTFTVTEINDDNTDGDDIVTGEPLDDTGSVVKDDTTGQSSVKGEPDANADPVPSGTKAGKSAKGSTGAGSST